MQTPNDTVYISHLPERMRDVRRAVAQTLNDCAMDTVTQAKTNASGRPGPNVDTGSLRNSIKHDSLATPQALKTQVKVGESYGIYLEFGTRKMPPYPFMQPAVEFIRKVVAIPTLKANINKVIK